MGVTDLRPNFTQIIGHNSINVHRIPTKLGTEIRLNEPFMYTKCQLNRSMHLIGVRPRTRDIKIPKDQRHQDAVEEVGCDFVPLVVETFGVWSSVETGSLLLTRMTH